MNMYPQMETPGGTCTPKQKYEWACCWNYFTGGRGNSVAPESASGSGSGLYTVVVDARLSGNKREKSVVTVPFLTASLLG